MRVRACVRKKEGGWRDRTTALDGLLSSEAIQTTMGGIGVEGVGAIGVRIHELCLDAFANGNFRHLV